MADHAQQFHSGNIPPRHDAPGLDRENIITAQLGGPGAPGAPADPAAAGATGAPGAPGAPADPAAAGATGAPTGSAGSDAPTILTYPYRRMRIVGGRPMQLALPRAVSRNEPGEAVSQNEPGDCVRHVYLLNQQPAGYDSDWYVSSSEGEPSVATPHVTAVKLSVAAQVASEIYPPSDGSGDSLLRVHVLEFVHDPIDPAVIEPPAAEEDASHPAYVNLYNNINLLPAEMVPQQQLSGTDQTGATNVPNPAPWEVDDRFTPIVSLFAMREPMRFRLMIAIPHLTIGTPDESSNNHTLEEYRRCIGGLAPTTPVNPDTNRDSQGGQIFVHRSTFMVINSDMIIMARTANDKQSSPFPFFPHQYRVSALHLLVHMIATALQFSARAVSDKLRRISMNLEHRTHRHVSADSTKMHSDQLKRYKKEGVKIGQELASHIADVGTILHLITTQLQVLADLAEIIENSAPHVKYKGYNQNIVQLPLLFQNREHNVIILDALQSMMNERRRFEEQIKPLLKEARKTQQNLGGTHVRLTTEKHAAHAKMSAETMSMFTIVTTIFLPLTFFTSYFALHPGEQTVKTHAEFWQYATVPTFAFAALTFYIVMLKKYTSGEYTEDRTLVKYLKRPFRRRIDRGPSDVEAGAAASASLTTLSTNTNQVNP